MTDNFGTGFDGFQSAIHMVTDDIGQRAFGAVARNFSSMLSTVIKMRKTGKPGMRWCASDMDWAEATAFDFDVAVEQELARWKRPEKEWPVEGTAQYHGVKLALRGDVIWAEGSRYRMPVIIASKDQWRTIEWNVFLTGDGKRLISGTCGEYGHASRPTSRATKTQAAAHRSMRSMLTTFFGVELE